MRVCYFGTYSKLDGYPRNRVIIKGLKKVGVEVEECHIDLWKDSPDKISGIGKGYRSFKKVFRIIKAQINLGYKFLKVKNYDAIIVGSIGHFEVFWAKLLNIFKRKPIVFDAFISLYDTIVNDRKLINPRSLLAKFLHWLDRYSCKLADIILLDTNANIDYFNRK